MPSDRNASDGSLVVTDFEVILLSRAVIVFMAVILSQEASGESKSETNSKASRGSANERALIDGCLHGYLGWPIAGGEGL